MSGLPRSACRGGGELGLVLLDHPDHALELILPERERAREAAGVALAQCRDQRGGLVRTEIMPFAGIDRRARRRRGGQGGGQRSRRLLVTRCDGPCYREGAVDGSGP